MLLIFCADALAATTVAAESVAKGSVGPTGAKLSNDSAFSVAGGDRELLVSGEGWLYTVVGIWKVLESKVAAGGCVRCDRVELTLGLVMG